MNNFFFLNKGLSEEIMKKNQTQNVINSNELLSSFDNEKKNGDSNVVRHFSRDDLRKLFILKIDTRSETKDLMVIFIFYFFFFFFWFI
jgi:hypothetical protein